jgi:hypothetical protein
MDVLRMAVCEPISKVNATLEGVYDYFGMESMTIVSGRNFYQTRLYFLVKTLESLCCSRIYAEEIYKALRQIYTETTDRIQFLMCAKRMIYPYLPLEMCRQGCC